MRGGRRSPRSIVVPPWTWTIPRSRPCSCSAWGPIRDSWARRFAWLRSCYALGVRMWMTRFFSHRGIASTESALSSARTSGLTFGLRSMDNRMRPPPRSRGRWGAPTRRREPLPRIGAPRAPQRGRQRGVNRQGRGRERRRGDLRRAYSLASPLALAVALLSVTVKRVVGRFGQATIA
jgi:hypothetical protein